MYKHTLKILLATIFLLAVFLRFYSLGTNPPALTWDETAWGYNAYTLGSIGHDEFRKFLPITYLESFGDFKPPVYAYLSILPVKLFGLNEFSTRFASAFFGSLTVLVVYFLVLEIFTPSKKKQYLALCTSFLLAISPWHILLSRAAFEANVATFFIILGVYLFLRSTQKTYNSWIFALSLISFVVAMNTFNTSRIFLPIFVPFLFVLRRKVFLINWKKAVFGLLPAIIISVPLLLFLLTPQAKLRYAEVNIFSDIQVIQRINQEVVNDKNSQFSKIIHNRRLAYGVEYIKHYLDNLDPGFLFIHGDGNPKFSIQDVGQLYIWEAPFLVLGILLLFRKREGSWWIVPVWFILGIAPAATARETPHALRIEVVTPMFQLLTVYGLIYSLFYIHDNVKNKMLRKSFYSGLGLIILGSFVYFAHTYFVHYPMTYATEWQYGYKEAIAFAELNKEKFKHIYMTEDLGRPYIYALFYGYYPPDTLKNAQITREALGFVHVNRFGKYTFVNELPFDKSDSLYINSPNKVPSGANIIKKFLLPNGRTILVAYEK